MIEVETSKKDVPIYWEDCSHMEKTDDRGRKLHSRFVYNPYSLPIKISIAFIWAREIEGYIENIRYWLEDSDFNPVATATEIDYLKRLVSGLKEEQIKEMFDALEDS